MQYEFFINDVNYQINNEIFPKVGGLLMDSWNCGRF